MWIKGSTYSQLRHYEEVGLLVLRSAFFTLQESTSTHFTGGLVNPRASLLTMEWIKISLFRYLGSNLGHLACSQAHCCLNHLARGTKIYFYQGSNNLTQALYPRTCGQATSMQGTDKWPNQILTYLMLVHIILDIIWKWHNNIKINSVIFIQYYIYFNKNTILRKRWDFPHYEAANNNVTCIYLTFTCGIPCNATRRC